MKQFSITVLRGIAQIFLVRSLVTGVLLLIAIGYYSVPMAGLTLLGAVLTTALGAGFADRDEQALADGLLGYNGALIGAAAFVSWPDLGPALVSTVLGSLAGAALTHVASRAAARFGIPVLTAPFVITAGLVSVIGAHYLEPAPLASAPSRGLLLDSLETVLNSIAQVVLVDSPISGAIVLLSLFVAGWRIGLAGLGGAVGALLFATVTGQDPITMRHGLLGFSAVLVAIALGAVFIDGDWLKRATVAGIGVLLVELLTLAGRESPVPVYTWPFILTTWLLIAVLPRLAQGTTSAPNSPGA